MRSYQRFLLLLGAVFVPLLGVLVAHWLYNGAHYSERDIFGSPSFRLGPIFSWAAGFLVYEWLYQPTGLGFWSDLMAKLPQPGYQVGASLPSFALAFVLTGVFQTLSSPRATMTAEPPTSTRSTSSAEPTTRA
jgi:purine-cytosine permease-like protein